MPLSIHIEIGYEIMLNDFLLYRLVTANCNCIELTILFVKFAL